MNSAVVIEYADNDPLELKDFIRSQFQNVIKVNKIKVSSKPTHSQMRKLKRGFMKDISDGALKRFSFSEEKGVFSYEVETLSEKPFIVSYGEATTTQDMLQQVKDFWTNLMKSIGVKHSTVEILEWSDDSRPNLTKPTGRKGPKHTPEWNKAIGDGRRGLRMKTKSRQGIEWDWKDGKKCWL